AIFIIINNLSYLRKLSKYGVIDKYNKVIIPFIYDYICCDEDKNGYKATLNNVMGHLNENGSFTPMN
ncbi:MAG: WG repeat-containing protein, partial [Bacteroidia bacterium]